MPVYGDEENAAALRIQKTLRGVAARSAHKVTPLTDDQLTDYAPFLIGNDTPLTTEQIIPHQINRNFVLIGTSLFRSIDIACKLAKSPDVFPKVVIIDNSRKTSLAWQQIKTFFATSTIESWPEFLNDDEDGFLEFTVDKLIDIARIDKDLPGFFKQFSKCHELSYIKKVIAGVIMIEQDWGHLDTFKKLGQIYAGRPIVTYVSNIIDYVEPLLQIKVIRCIDSLKPCLTLCTNLHPSEKKPTMSYLFTNCKPLVIAEALDLTAEVKTAFKSNETTLVKTNPKKPDEDTTTPIALA